MAGTSLLLSAPLAAADFVVMVGFRFPEGLSFFLSRASSFDTVCAAGIPCDFGDVVEVEDEAAVLTFVTVVVAVEFAEAGTFESEVVVPLKKL